MSTAVFMGAAALALLSVLLVSTSRAGSVHAVLAAMSNGQLQAELRQVKAKAAELDELHGDHGGVSAALPAASPYILPMGSLAEQASDGSPDPEKEQLENARHELALENRLMLASKLRAAQSRQDAIQQAVQQRSARVRQWRERQQARNLRVRERAYVEEQKHDNILAIKHAGSLGFALTRVLIMC